MKEKTINKKNIFSGRIVRLDLIKIELPNKKHSTREIISHPGAVAVLPVLPDGKIIFVRQYRKAVEKSILEIPAGTLAKNESPVKCAKRELIEETGFRARHMKKIADFYPSAGYSTERIYIFKATGLIKTVKNPEPDEFLKTVILPLATVKRLIRKKKIKDGKTLIALTHLK